MRWPLFTWMLAGGIFGMFWFLYLSMTQDAKRWKPIAHYMRRPVSRRRRDGTLANA
jgi:hypothetical protein